MKRADFKTFFFSDEDIKVWRNEDKDTMKKKSPMVMMMMVTTDVYKAFQSVIIPNAYVLPGDWALLFTTLI